ncbi:catechol 1,2-dioxygenase [Mycobacterium sp. JS623]|uniref:catechol 1,2-dioxygenase n=1 Tax=Mycobacterium sp. JS623 TaxID=212767 RepID=UPI0002A59930|nr:catechol 1,2-dioxygenase [Mycobacterium sp. JS623]AGB22341.1 catechol 1,2-dioxygenase [Mycobacterium sp. JS623]
MTDIATAAQSGASATARFQQRARDGAHASTERVNTLVSEMISAAHDIVRRHHLTYPEYDALKAWLIQVGLDGEWPLFLDVFLEHAVEQEVNAERPGSKGTIEGPYYVPGAPSLPAQTTLPMREDEPGTPLRFAGRVQRVDGRAIDNATIDIWHADDAGFYSQFAPGLPEWNLRGVVHADGQGRFDITTIVPAPYQIPTDGATGTLLAAAGWTAWRPAHLHVKVSAPGYRLITSQLYFDGGEYLHTDIASAVKPELILHPTPVVGQGLEVNYDFVLDAD